MLERFVYFLNDMRPPQEFRKFLPLNFSLSHPHHYDKKHCGNFRFSFYLYFMYQRQQVCPTSKSSTLLRAESLLCVLSHHFPRWFILKTLFFFLPRAVTNFCIPVIWAKQKGPQYKELVRLTKHFWLFGFCHVGTHSKLLICDVCSSVCVLSQCKFRMVHVWKTPAI